MVLYLYIRPDDELCQAETCGLNKNFLINSLLLCVTVRGEMTVTSGLLQREPPTALQNMVQKK